MTAKKQAGL